MNTPAATGEDPKETTRQDTIRKLQATIQTLEEENVLLRKSKSRPLMRARDWHCNIMLDLECASASTFNPILLEIGAIHFDIETGEELSSFHSIINWQSCEEHGLTQDSSSVNFVKANMPETFRMSKEGGSALPVAVKKFSTWILNRKKAAQELNKKAAALENLGTAELQRARLPPQAMVWGNGASSDNPWIKSAFRACNLPLPWEYYNDRCYRTFVEEWNPDTAKLMRQSSMFQSGVKHRALDDCKHQVTVLVRARNELHGRPVKVLEAASRNQKESAVTEVAKISSVSSLKRKTSPVHDHTQGKSTKLSKADITRFRSEAKGRLQSKPKPKTKLETLQPSIPNPDESMLEEIEREYNAKVLSFNRNQADSEPILKQPEVEITNELNTALASTNKGRAVKSSMGLITPSTSFSGAPAGEEDVPSSSPTPEWWAEFNKEDLGDFS